jgi:hypothetical protein
MGRKKFFNGYFGMCAMYDVIETTTHKAVLGDGSIIRTDMDGLYILHDADGMMRSSWMGDKDTVWTMGRWKKNDGDIIPISDLEWEEDSFTYEYEFEKDVS